MFDIPPEGLPPVDPSAADGWDPNQKIVIIGAGAAGLSAAYTLNYLGVPFILLEASSTCGGRVQHSEDFLGNGVALDTGAEWLHTTRDASVLKELLLDEVDRKDAEKFIQEEIIEYLPSDLYYGNARTGGLRKNKLLKSTGLLEIEYKFRTKSWSQYFEKYFVSRVKDRTVCNAVVTEIEYSSPDTCKVILKDGSEYVAAKVICAVPVSVLKEVDIVFKPPLPRAKQNALAKTKMKPALKVAIEFKERFYQKGGVFYDIGLLSSVFWLVFDYGSEREFFDALTNKDVDDKHVLSLYCSGALAEELAGLPDDEIFSSCMEKLDRMFDDQATKHYVKHMVTNWTKVDFIRGGYSNLWHMQLMTKEFTSSLNDKVFFAGEFVGGKYGPTVHGACLTGRRAALNALGKEYDYK